MWKNIPIYYISILTAWLHNANAQFLFDECMITVQTSLQGSKKTCLNQCPRIIYFSSKNEKEDRWPNNISYSNKMLWKFLRRLLPPIWGSIVVTKATLCTLTIFCYSSIIRINRKMKKCWSVYFCFSLNDFILCLQYFK